MKEKIKRLRNSIVALTMVVVMLGTSGVAYAAAPTVSLPSSSEATIKDFTVKRTCAVYYNCDQPVEYTVAVGTVVGYNYNYIGRYRAKDKVDGKYYDAIIIKSAMTPKEFYAKSGKKLYGFSQYLQYSMTLANSQCYQANSPTNDTTGSTEYSVGVSAGVPKEASFSASVSLNSKYCDVTDYSDISKNKFKVAFDYKPSVIDLRTSSDRNKMLFNQTWQMGTCEWTTSTTSYNVQLTIYAKFGVASKKNGGGMFLPLGSYSSKRTSTFTCNYAN